MDFMMSVEQLDELWKYEFRLCAVMTGLPLRNCSAKPNSQLDHRYAPMSPDSFRMLKQEILQMWVRAAHYFRFKNVPGKGWGIFIPSDDDKGFPTTGHLSQVKGHIMGWLATAPTLDECPTGHRYLRSPVEPNLYLGGPISLANQDDVSRISVNFPTTNSMASRYLVTVTKMRTLSSGSELLWSYSPRSNCRTKLTMHPYHKWFCQCCSEEMVPLMFSTEQNNVPAASTSISKVSAGLTEPPAKMAKRPVGGIRPLKRTNLIPRYCWCTLCGVNVDAGKQYAPNLKRHLSLNHAEDIVKDMGKDPADSVNLMDPKEFVLHVDTIDNVLDALHHSYISYHPACMFLEHCGEVAKLKGGVPIELEKERVFQLFLKESASAFHRYQVVYLRGATIPTRYEDLIPCNKKTSYDTVVWKNEKPSNTNFSINQLNLSEKEKNEHKMRVQCMLREVFASHQVYSS